MLKESDSITPSFVLLLMAWVGLLRLWLNFRIQRIQTLALYHLCDGLPYDDGGLHCRFLKVEGIGQISVGFGSSDDFCVVHYSN